MRRKNFSFWYLEFWCEKLVPKNGDTPEFLRSDFLDAVASGEEIVIKVAWRQSAIRNYKKPFRNRR